MLPSNKLLAKSILIFGGAQAFTVLAGLVRSKVAAETIGTSGVGLNAILVTIVLFATQLFGLGLSGSGVKYLAVDGEERNLRLSRLRLWSVLAALSSIVLISLAAPFISQIYADEGGQTWWFVLLSLAVALQIVSQNEMAILRSFQLRRQLTHAIVASSICSVLFSVPFFFFWGIEGVIWSVFACHVSSSLYIIAMGLWAVPHGHYPFRLLVPTWKVFFRETWPLLSLGLAFLLSGIISQGVELITQTVLTIWESISLVGLYKSGFMISITYPALIFSAMGNDFYPRLASVSGELNQRNRLTSQLICVLLSISIPSISIFWFVVPYIIPILLSDTFLAIVPMSRWAMCAVILQSVSLPLGYLPLALGKAIDFSFLEVISLVQKCLCVLGGYRLGGLEGCGMGILLSAILDVLVMGVFAHVRYHYRFILHK